MSAHLQVPTPIIQPDRLARAQLRMLTARRVRTPAGFLLRRPDDRTVLMPDQLPARRTQQERREQTERKVIAAATALIAERGSRALTLAQVGAAAGYSRGIVSHHFGSRENLLRAVMRDAQAFDLPDPGESAGVWLSDTVRAYLKNVSNKRPAARAFLQMWGEAIASDPVLMPLYAEQDARFRGLLADTVREGISDGSVRADADPEAMAVYLLGLLRGIALQLISTSPPADVEAIIDEAGRATQRALKP